MGPKNVDAIQPMRNGWQIYVKIDTDRQKLLTTGLELAGKSIDLQAPIWDPNFSQNVKIILKDLPLNEVINERVLMTLKSLEGVDVQSPVCYSNIFISSQRTHLRNGDWFVYIMEQSVSKLAKSLIIKDYPIIVIKPVIYSRCSCYQNIGHKANSAHAPPEVSDSI